FIRDPDKHFGSWRIIDALRAPIGRMGSLSLFGRCATSPRQPSAIRPYVTPNKLNGFRIRGRLPNDAAKRHVPGTGPGTTRLRRVAKTRTNSSGMRDDAGRGAWSRPVGVLDPFAVVVFVIFLFDRAPGNAMGARFVVPVLVPGAVVCLFVDLLRLRRQAVLHGVRQVAFLVIRHDLLLSISWNTEQGSCRRCRQANRMRAPLNSAGSSVSPSPGAIPPSCVRRVTR